jgi:hypothetical protein
MIRLILELFSILKGNKIVKVEIGTMKSIFELPLYQSGLVSNSPCPLFWFTVNGIDYKQAVKIVCTGIHSCVAVLVTG